MSFEKEYISTVVEVICIFAKGDKMSTIQDQPERWSLAYSMGGNSNYCGRWVILSIGKRNDIGLGVVTP